MTHVTGLHYCYEEEVGEDLFLNKYDDFFVRRGEAVIRVRLDSLSRVEFTGEKREKRDETLLEARIRTDRGSAATAWIVCHRGGFLKGDLDLGEFRLGLKDVKTMVFPAGERMARSAFRCRLPDDKEEGKRPSGAVNLVLGQDGVLRKGGRDSRDAVEDFSGPPAKNVYLEIAPEVPFRKARGVLKKLAQWGVGEVVIAPSGP